MRQVTLADTLILVTVQWTEPKNNFHPFFNIFFPSSHNITLYLEWPLLKLIDGLKKKIVGQGIIF